MTDQPQKPASATSPWNWARVIYAALALARAVDAASAAVGIKQAGQGLRKAFADAIGEGDG